MQNVALYSAMPSEWSTVAKNRKKIPRKTNVRRISSDLKSHTHENYEISKWRRLLKDLQWTPFDAEFQALFSGAVRMKRSCQKQKNKYEKKEIFDEFEVIWSQTRTRIGKFLNEGDSWMTSNKRHSMQNFELYSVALPEWNPVAKNRKKIRKTNIRRNSSKRTL